jgi:hypothetical protein
MAIQGDFKGTTQQSFQVQKGGARIKNNSGVLQVRNAADNAYATMEAATPSADDNTNKVATTAYVQSEIANFETNSQLNARDTANRLWSNLSNVPSWITTATAFGQSLVTAANAATVKTLLSLVKADVGLGNVDNTSDANKPVSTATQTALNAKLNSSSYTASDVLSKVLTVDGVSSGLDADLLDGQHGSYYTNASNLNAGTVSAARMPALTGDVTTSAGNVATTLANSGVSAGSYGSASNVPVLTIDAKGRVTNASNTPITLSAVTDIVTVTGTSINCSLGTVFSKDFSSNITMSITGVPSGGFYECIVFVQNTSDSTRTMTWTGVTWNVNPSSVPGGVTFILGLITRDGGSSWNGRIIR